MLRTFLGSPSIGVFHDTEKEESIRALQSDHGCGMNSVSVKGR